MSNQSNRYNLPQFSQVDPEKIEQQISDILSQNLNRIDDLLQQTDGFDWSNLMQPLEDLDDTLHNAWSPVSHMNSVVNSDALRKAYNGCIPKLSDYSSSIGHNKTLFKAIESIANSEDFPHLSVAQQKILQNEIRDFKLTGIDLPEQEKKQHAEISKTLSQLTTKFEENVLDATNGWIKQITDDRLLQGIPEHAIASAKAAAKQRELEGFVFTLEFPSYYAVMCHANSRELRQEMYTAYCTRASDQGPGAGKWDNTPVMQAILENRLKLANLLGFNNFAEYSIATKMVPDTTTVLDFLTNLATASIAKAKQEFTELCDFAKETADLDKLAAWDLAYFAEKLREHRYAISDEELRPYFPEYKVVSGLFHIVSKLFNVTFSKLDDVDVWHPDATCFAMHDTDGNVISLFYFDLYARENKRGGAWMDDCRIRRLKTNGDLQTPVAYVTCNFNAPSGGDPALFTHNEVVTLFHEFGHSLQHMLTKIQYSEVSGINGIPWDAVEVASQFLENWAWQAESIHFISEHYQTKAGLPEALFERMHRAKNFQSAMQMVRQLELALFDFKLHMEFDPAQQNQVATLLADVRKSVSVVPTPEFNRFQHSFSHIFAGGYAAGYYSYKWAEVMACDAFGLFKENGIFDPKTSQSFRETFLESGGAIEPMDLFIQFRGRKPEVASLLQADGIID